MSPGDGGSSADDYGIYVSKCVDFIIKQNRFEHFGHGAVGVRHTEALARGLISHNEFYHNLKYISSGGTTTGYGVVIDGGSQEWIPDAQFGTDNFIFIEDNHFFEHRHAVAGGSTARYVFRYNTVIDNLWGQAIDAHGGGNYGNSYSVRAYEVYENYISNTRFLDGISIASSPSTNVCDALTYRAMYFRGGEGLIFNNIIEGFRHGIGITTEITGNYPVNSQIGYQSAISFGSNHAGSDLSQGNGDLFEWNNNFSPVVEATCVAKFRNFRENLLIESRDFHLNTAKPNYTPYIYPHPLNN